jgi:Leucine-rich repeat (LRR) protein
MNNCELQSLDNFPHLKNLIGLELSDNQLTGEDVSKITHCGQINFITLDNNNISSISPLQSLNVLIELEILQVHDNPIANEGQYR